MHIESEIKQIKEQISNSKTHKALKLCDKRYRHLIKTVNNPMYDRKYKKLVLSQYKVVKHMLKQHAKSIKE